MKGQETRSRAEGNGVPVVASVTVIQTETGVACTRCGGRVYYDGMHLRHDCKSGERTGKMDKP